MGRVEIIFHDHLLPVYFLIPPMCQIFSHEPLGKMWETWYVVLPVLFLLVLFLLVLTWRELLTFNSLFPVLFLFPSPLLFPSSLPLFSSPLLFLPPHSDSLPRDDSNLVKYQFESTRIFDMMKQERAVSRAGVSWMFGTGKLAFIEQVSFIMGVFR